MIRPEAIISDADGTLVDTVHLIRHGQYETSKTYLLQKGVQPEAIPSYDDYEKVLNRTVGGSARDTLERTVKEIYKNTPRHLDGLDYDELHDLLNPVQDKIAPEFVNGYEGLSRLLKELGRLGIKLAIFTSGTPHHVVRNFGVSLPELEMTKLYKSKEVTDEEKLRRFEQVVETYFEIPDFTVITCDDVVAHKPDPASLNLAMERLGVAPEESLVFGDHSVDMKSGINAGVPIRVGVTHGFNGDKELLDAGATQVVHSLDELTDQLW